MWQSNVLPLYNTAMTIQEEKATKDDHTPGIESKAEQKKREPEYLAPADHKSTPYYVKIVIWQFCMLSRVISIAKLMYMKHCRKCLLR